MRHKQTVLIIDYGSQYTQLIARRIREQNVYSEILPHSATSDEIIQRSPIAVVLSGGPDSVYAKGAPTLDSAVIEMDVPVLGICYGFGLLMNHDGGVVKANGQREYGFAELSIENGGKLFNGVTDKTQVWMSHGDKVHTLANDFRSIAHTSSTPYAACEHKELPVFGVQFHPELKSRPFEPHPLFASFIEAAKVQSRLV